MNSKMQFKIDCNTVEKMFWDNLMLRCLYFYSSHVFLYATRLSKLRTSVLDHRICQVARSFNRRFVHIKLMFTFAWSFVGQSRYDQNKLTSPFNPSNRVFLSIKPSLIQRPVHEAQLTGSFSMFAFGIIFLHLN